MSEVLDISRNNQGRDGRGQCHMTQHTLCIRGNKVSIMDKKYSGQTNMVPKP